MKQTLLLIVLTSISVVAFSQNERKFVRNGNKLFLEAVNDTTQSNTEKFNTAEKEYRKALEKKPDDPNWNFNLADALYKQKRFDEAAEKFKDLTGKMETPEEKARVLHNQGNSQLMQQKIDESIESYKEALRLNPNDLDTKYNLAYAQNLKKQQQNQDQNQNQIRIKTTKTRIIKINSKIRINKIRIRIKTSSSNLNKIKFQEKMPNSCCRLYKTTNVIFRIK
jgi:Ca-activated chloride channel homolog